MKKPGTPHGRGFVLSGIASVVSLGMDSTPAHSLATSPNSTVRTDSESSQQAPLAKKLIELGWDEPTAAYLRTHQIVVEQSPFDGLIFQLYLAPGSPQGSLSTNAFGTRAFTEADVKPELEALKSLKLSKLANSFLAFNVMPGDVDWFDSFNGVTANAELTARSARLGGLRGVFFDFEAYGKGEPFRFSRQRHATERGFASYTEQARLRGREVIAAFERGYPGLTIFLTYGYSLPYQSIRRHWCKDLAGCPQGLSKAFLDGMLEAASGSTEFIEGDEFAYGLHDEAEFRAEVLNLKSQLPDYSGSPEIYRRRFRVALPVFIDYKKTAEGWSDTDESKNYYSATQLETAIRGALATADEFVWLYSEKPRFWTGDGKPSGAPATYQAALKRAKSDRQERTDGGQ